jgi:hypothetical protein
MPRIYITYRPQDTGTDEVRQIVRQLGQAFGAENIRLTDANSQVDVLALYDEVQVYDALLVIVGLRWLDMRNSGGRRLIDDPFDYVYTEIYAALEKEEMWVTTLLVDGAQLPKSESLPENIRDLLRHDVIRLYEWHKLAEQVEELRRRMAVIDASVPFERQRETPVSIPQAPIVFVQRAEVKNVEASRSRGKYRASSRTEGWMRLFGMLLGLLAALCATIMELVKSST